MASMTIGISGDGGRSLPLAIAVANDALLDLYPSICFTWTVE